MGIEQPINTTTLKKIRRCSLININAPHGQPQSITQEYETVVLEDDVVISRKQADVYYYSVPDMAGISIDIGDEKIITGLDVMKFFYIFNDNREVYLPVPPTE